jgi:hypothetical protein
MNRKCGTPPARPLPSVNVGTVSRRTPWIRIEIIPSQEGNTIIPYSLWHMEECVSVLYCSLRPAPSQPLRANAKQKHAGAESIFLRMVMPINAEKAGAGF